MMKIKKVISGGQIGVDRAAFDAAIRTRIEIGGWIPQEGKDNLVATYGNKFKEVIGYHETARKDVKKYYPSPRQASITELMGRLSRTRKNVLAADFTLIVTMGCPMGGTKATIDYAKDAKKPYHVVDICNPQLSQVLEKLQVQKSCRVLNIAGDADARIYKKAMTFLVKLLAQNEPVLLRNQSGKTSKSTMKSPVVEGLASGVLDQVYAARSEFIASANQGIYLSTLALTAGGAGFLGTSAMDLKETHATLLHIMSCVAFLLPWIGYGANREKIRAGYDLYSASVFHATHSYCSLSFPFSHLWMQYALRSMKSVRYRFYAGPYPGFLMGCLPWVARKWVYDLISQLGLAPRGKNYFQEISTERDDCDDFDYVVARTHDEGWAPATIGQFCAVWRSIGNNLFVAYMWALRVLTLLGLVAFVATLYVFMY